MGNTLHSGCEMFPTEKLPFLPALKTKPLSCHSFLDQEFDSGHRVDIRLIAGCRTPSDLHGASGLALNILPTLIGKGLNDNDNLILA